MSEQFKYVTASEEDRSWGLFLNDAGYSEVEGGAINFNAAFAIPAFVDFLGSPTFWADVNEHDFTFAFNVPGENVQKTNELSLKADWSLNAFDVMAVAAYNDLDEYLLSDGTSATFYGYELTDRCQQDRRFLSLRQYRRLYCHNGFR